ncbi:MAG: bifunctional 5,10-methylenetetrahydrofolate dehydrogenase/5,10-methenyltetrahydrofolate cyclohydrolase [Planctomycetota bacterium]
MSRLLSGVAAAEAIRADVARDVAALVAGGAAPPCLAAVRVGEDPASALYVRNKMRACGKAGIVAREHRLPAGVSQDDLVGLVRRLGEAADVDGILVQMPLPEHLDRRSVNEAVDPDKDADGFHPINVGRLWSGQPGFVPCTPLGVIELLDRERIGIEGARAVVLGRSEIVGRPMAALLLRRHATVTICHSRTRDRAPVAARADILVAALGRAACVTRNFIKLGATVIDVGINQVREESRARELFGEDATRLEQVRRKGYTLVGDVHPRDAAERAGAHTPVPGGIGPLTVALLLRNTLRAARARRVRAGPGGGAA